MGKGEGSGRGIRGYKRGVDSPMVGSHPIIPISEILKKYPDCKTLIIGEATTQTFAPGIKYSRAATASELALFCANADLQII